MGFGDVYSQDSIQKRVLLLDEDMPKIIKSHEIIQKLPGHLQITWYSNPAILIAVASRS